MLGYRGARGVLKPWPRFQNIRICLIHSAVVNFSCLNSYIVVRFHCTELFFHLLLSYLQKVTLRIDKCSHSQIMEDDGQVIEHREECEIEGEIWGSSM